MRKSLAEINLDINDFSREELDEIGYVLTINTDKEAMVDAFNKSWVDLSDDIRECLISLRKGNGALFGKWHSFSLKIMNEIIPDEFLGLKYIPVDAVSDKIYNPVVRRIPASSRTSSTFLVTPNFTRSGSEHTNALLNPFPFVSVAISAIAPAP